MTAKELREKVEQITQQDPTAFIKLFIEGQIKVHEDAIADHEFDINSLKHQLKKLDTPVLGGENDE